MDAEQAEAYKERQRAEWDSSAEGLKTWALTMEAYTRPVVDQLVGLVDLQPGDRVLDVATGLGGMALDAAEAVGPEGEVHATDLSPAMIGIAKERAAETEVGGRARSPELTARSAVNGRGLCRSCRALISTRPQYKRESNRELLDLFSTTNYNETSVTFARSF